MSQIKDKNVVAGCLDGLEAVFERAEELLAKSRTGKFLLYIVHDISVA